MNNPLTLSEMLFTIMPHLDDNGGYDPSSTYIHDATKDSCRAFCDSFDACEECPVGKSILDNDYDRCIISTIAKMNPPFEEALSTVLKWNKQKESEPKTYIEDYDQRIKGDRTGWLHVGDHEFPPVCRMILYNSKDGKQAVRCPGDKPCWACWECKMTD